MKFKRSITLAQSARMAFLDHLVAYNQFSESLARFENKALKIEDMKVYFDMSLQTDRKWLEAEARNREAAICHMTPDDYDRTLDEGIEQNRLVALRYLCEECGVKI